MPYLSYLSVFCPAAPTENASIHGRANTPRERPARVGPELFKAYLLASSLRQTAIALLPSPLLSPAPFLFPRFRYSSRYLSYPRYTHTHTRARTYMAYKYIYVYTVREGRKKMAEIFRKGDRSIEEIDRSEPNWSRIERKEEEEEGVGRRSEATSIERKS